MSDVISFDQSERRLRPGIVAGIAISLALHALLLLGYRLPTDTPHPTAKTMTVWLTPPTPPAPAPVVAKVEPKLEPRPHRTPAPARPATGRPTVAAQAITPPAQPAESQAATLPPDPLNPDQQPKQFDMNEALKTARKVAKEKAPAGSLTAQLEAHPINTEPPVSEAAKKIASAKKTDCLQSGAGMGLLAPLAWAFDKHCKF